MSTNKQHPGRIANMDDRRRFLFEMGCGIGGMGLMSLLQGDGLFAQDDPAPAGQGAHSLSSKRGHYPAKAERVIEIFCPGGLSHVDTWDYKPELEKMHGHSFDAELGKQTFAGIAGKLSKSFWPFRRHGECGRWMSDLFPKLAEHVDDMAFVYSMQNKSALHGPAMFMMNSGFVLPGFPAMGAWVTYGLGSESENLPAYVVLPDPRGLPPGGNLNWGAGFLPAVYQGTVIEADKQRAPIADLFASDGRSLDSEIASRKFLNQLNEHHARQRGGDHVLRARMSSYELAARMQLSAPEAVDLSNETQSTMERYMCDDESIGPFGRQCLLARRLIERGVRFVQIFCGAENTSKEKIRPNWDSHEDIARDHGYWGRILDTGASALLADLKARGLLESTLIICTTEFGRQPFMQGEQKGRDHNPGAFTSWLAGGGIRGGTSHGSSDPIGFQALEPIFSYDLHATALHLLGIDHKRLTYYHDGIQRRLTDVHGRLIEGIL